MFEIKFKALLNKINPNIIFEFGSYNGKDAIKYRNWFPNAEIYSFEPNPFLFKNIVKNIKKFNINCFNIGFGNKNEELPFTVTNSVVNDEYESQGSFKRHTEQFKNENKNIRLGEIINVKTTTINDFCKENNISNVDYMHIDVEGFTKEVLEGLGDIKPLIIYAETIDSNLYYDGDLTTIEYNKLLLEMNYESILFDEVERSILYYNRDNISNILTPNANKLFEQLNDAQKKISELIEIAKEIQSQIRVDDEFFKSRFLL